MFYAKISISMTLDEMMVKMNGYGVRRYVLAWGKSALTRVGLKLLFFVVLASVMCHGGSKCIFRVRIKGKPIKQGASPTPPTRSTTACAARDHAAVVSCSPLVAVLEGIKVYALCCGESGFCFLLHPMTWNARDPKTEEFIKHHRGAGDTVDLVSFILSLIPDIKGKVLVADSWFANLRVVDLCTSLGVGFIGSLKNFGGEKSSALWQVRGVAFALPAPGCSSSSFVALRMNHVLPLASRLQKKSRRECGSAHMLFYEDPPRAIQQWADGDNVVTLVTNDVTKCVRGSAALLRKVEASGRAADHGEPSCWLRSAAWTMCACGRLCHKSVAVFMWWQADTRERETKLPPRYVLKCGVGLVQRYKKVSGETPLTLPCPALVMAYQSLFRAVDRNDLVRAWCVTWVSSVAHPWWPTSGPCPVPAHVCSGTQLRAGLTVHQFSHRSHLGLLWLGLDVALVSRVAVACVSCTCGKRYATCFNRSMPSSGTSTSLGMCPHGTNSSSESNSWTTCSP
jgi:hypothetical protein